MTRSRRRGVTRAVIAIAAVCLIFAALLAGRRDFGPAIGITAAALASITAGLVSLLSTREKP
jgi:hypothetical protein